MLQDLPSVLKGEALLVGTDVLGGYMGLDKGVQEQESPHPQDQPRQPSRPYLLGTQTDVRMAVVLVVEFHSLPRDQLHGTDEHEGKEPLKAAEFLKLMREKKALVGMDNKLTNRSVNEGFSGGEKKRNEIFQMAMLEPCLSILDETDSGLDIDALRIVAEGVNKLKRPDTSSIVITHYQRLLDYIKPDIVHVLYNGRIVMTAGPELVQEPEERGYDWIKNENQ